MAKAKVFKQKYGAKLDFWTGGRVQTEKPTVGEYGYFFGTTHCSNLYGPLGQGVLT